MKKYNVINGDTGHICLLHPTTLKEATNSSRNMNRFYAININRHKDGPFRVIEVEVEE